MHFAKLPMPKLKNKVVCEEHFKNECFMNYKKDSLTKSAVPTEMPKKVNPVAKKDTKIIIAPAATTTSPEPDNEVNYVIEELFDEPKRITIIESNLPEAEEESETKDQDQDQEKYPTFVGQEESCAEFLPMLVKVNEELDKLKTLMTLNNKMSLDILKSKTEEKAVQPEPPSSTSNMKKRDLFKAMKRHINPVMATLLGLELFASSDHQWLEDEKELAMELHNQGEPVYKFFRDEFRLRLPAIADVEAWKKEHQD